MKYLTLQQQDINLFMIILSHFLFLLYSGNLELILALKQMEVTTEQYKKAINVCQKALIYDKPNQDSINIWQICVRELKL
ncbi:hypothetical protein pb186bvf_020047 [Paramecium bursaria]